MKHKKVSGSLKWVQIAGKHETLIPKYKFLLIPPPDKIPKMIKLTLAILTSLCLIYLGVYMAPATMNASQLIMQKTSIIIKAF